MTLAMLGYSVLIALVAVVIAIGNAPSTDVPPICARYPHVITNRHAANADKVMSVACEAWRKR